MFEQSPPTKAEMLARIRAERAKLETLLDSLTPEQMTTPNVHDTWSVKDVLAHIAAWERLALERLHSALTGEPLRIPPVSTDEQIDALNARFYAENKDRPLTEVRAEFDAAHREILAKVDAMDEAFFQGPIPAEWAGGREVWVLISANTCWHYPEHREAIEKWIREGV